MKSMPRKDSENRKDSGEEIAFSGQIIVRKR